MSRLAKPLFGRTFWSVAAGLAGGLVAGLLTNALSVRVLGVAVAVWVVNLASVQMRVEMLYRSLVRRPEGGGTPRGIPGPARHLDHQLQASRIGLRMVEHTGSEGSLEVVETAQQIVRAAAVQAASAGYANAARDVVVFRTPYAGADHAEESWQSIVQAGLDGIAEGRTLKAGEPDAGRAT